MYLEIKKDIVIKNVIRIELKELRVLNFEREVSQILDQLDEDVKQYVIKICSIAHTEFGELIGNFELLIVKKQEGGVEPRMDEYPLCSAGIQMHYEGDAEFLNFAFQGLAQYVEEYGLKVQKELYSIICKKEKGIVADIIRPIIL